MLWRQRIMDLLAEILRLGVRCAIIIDGFAITAASVYVICKLCWFTIRYLDRTIFSAPW